jgi:methylphosphotriester-DNA--protein-cysteine methyltransferase
VSRYVEHPAPAGGSDAVTCTWIGVGGWARSLRVLPDGCADVAWDGERLRVAPAIAAPVRYQVTPSDVHVGVRLRPAWAGTVLGCPAGDVPPGLPLVEVLDAAAVARTEDALRTQTSVVARRRALLDLVDLAAAGARPDPRVVTATELLARGASVADAALAVGASPRHLRRLFRHHVGLGPKAFHRVARLRRFLQATRAASPVGAESLGRQAAAAGYSDQAHLVHECALLTGSTPRALRERAEAPAGRARPGR